MAAARQNSKPRGRQTRSKSRSVSRPRNAKKTEPKTPKPEPRQTRSRSVAAKPQPVVPVEVPQKTMPEARTIPTVVPAPRPAVISPVPIQLPILPIPSAFHPDSSNQSEIIQDEPSTSEPLITPVIEKKPETIISNLTLYTAVLIIFSLCLWSLTNLAERGRGDMLPSWWFTFKRDNEHNLPDPVSVAISSISVLVAKASWNILKKQ